MWARNDKNLSDKHLFVLSAELFCQVPQLMNAIIFPGTLYIILFCKIFFYIFFVGHRYQTKIRAMFSQRRQIQLSAKTTNRTPNSAVARMHVKRRRMVKVNDTWPVPDTRQMRSSSDEWKSNRGRRSRINERLNLSGLFFTSPTHSASVSRPSRRKINDNISGDSENTLKWCWY